MRMAIGRAGKLGFGLLSGALWLIACAQAAELRSNTRRLENAPPSLPSETLPEAADDPDLDPEEQEDIQAGQGLPASTSRSGIAFLGDPLASLRIRLPRLGQLPAKGRALLGSLSPPPSSMAELWQSAPPYRSVAFKSLDLTRHDRFLTLGTKLAHDRRMDRPGWRTMVTLGIRLAEYDPSLARTAHCVSSARLLGGYEWHRGPLAITAMAGVSILRHPPSRAWGTGRTFEIGPAAGLDLWLNWQGPLRWGSRHSLASLLLDQAERSVFFRFQHAFALAGTQIRFGPEISYSAGRDIAARGVSLQGGWRKLRAGAHISELPLWRARIGAAFGTEWQPGQKPGLYVTLSAYRLIY